MDIDLKGIVIIVGNYGSGKTEVAINLALHRKRAGIDVRIGDLDLVNPYFRTREAKKMLNRFGIDVVIPPEQFFHADLPILTPAISGMIRRPSELTILDAGGDDAGVTVLASLANVFENKDVRMLQVVNPYRPHTDTIEGCIKIRREIEKAAKMEINGLVGNTNLIDDTKIEDIYKGYEFLSELSEKSVLPLELITAPDNLIPALDAGRFACPVLSIERQLTPPWKKPVQPKVRV